MQISQIIGEKNKENKFLNKGPQYLNKLATIFFLCLIFLGVSVQCAYALPAWVGSWIEIPNGSIINPRQINIDNQDTIYVLESSPLYQRVLFKNTSDLNAPWIKVDGQVFSNGYDALKGIANDGQGNLYVLNGLTGSNNILWKVTNPKSANPTWTDITKGTNIVGFYQPQSIASDSQGNIYILDRNNGTATPTCYIWKRSTSGTWTQIRSFSAYAEGIEVDSSGNVYVSYHLNNHNPLNDWIEVLKKGSSTWDAVVAKSSNMAGYVSKGINVDKFGNLYAASQEMNYIRTITAGSDTWVYLKNNPSFSSPTDVATDSKGNIYMIDGGADKIYRRDCPITQLAWKQYPGTSVANSPISPVPVLELRGPSGELYPYKGANIALSISGNTGANLNGTKTISFTNGIASYANAALSIDKAGTYTLDAAATINNENAWNYEDGNYMVLKPTILQSTSKSFVINPVPAQPVTCSIPSGSLITKDTVLILSSSTPGGNFHYTTDGSDPTINSFVTVGNNFTLGSVILYPEGKTVTLKVMVSAPGYANSAIRSFTYTFANPTELPTASIANGTTVSNKTQVNLTCPTSGATIYYTTDGTEPTVNSPSGSAVEINGQPGTEFVIKAFAVAPNMAKSETITFNYHIKSRVSDPAAIPTGTESTSFAKGTKISLTCSTNGAAIHYTLNGTPPDENSPVASEIQLDGQFGETVTLKLLATKMDMDASNIVTFTYRLEEELLQQVVAPTASIASGTTVSNKTQVNLTCPTSGATIYYTTDGTEPTVNSPSGSAIVINGQFGTDFIIKAVAVVPGMQSSEVVTFTYSIEPPIGPAIQILTNSLPNGKKGTYYSAVLQTNSTLPVNWTIVSGALPSGIHMDDNGNINGTPTSEGIFDISIKAENANGTNTKTLQINIASGSSELPPAPTNGVVNDTANTFNFTAAAGYDGASLYEYSTDGGANWNDCISFTINVGNISVSAGNLQVRLKSTTEYNSGNILSSTEAFTAELEGTVSITGNAKVGETLTAETQGIQTGTVLHYQWKAGSVNIGEDKKTYKVAGNDMGKTITVTADSYMGKLTSPATGVIGKGSAQIANSGILNISNRQEQIYRFNLKALLTNGVDFGNVNYSVVSGDATDYYQAVTDNNISDGILTIKARNVVSSEEKKIGGITLKITSQYYEDMQANININSTNKMLPITDVTGIFHYVYGEKLSDRSITGSATHNGDPVYGKFVWTLPDYKVKVSDTSAKWSFIPDDTGKYLATEGVADITVSKATLSGTPLFTAIKEAGKKLSEVALTAPDGWPSGNFSWVDGEGTVVAANTAYGWVFTADDTDNYNVLTGTATPYITGGGSSGGGHNHGGGASGSTVKPKELAKPEEKPAQNKTPKSLEEVKKDGAEKVKNFKDVKESSWFYEGTVYALGNGWFAGTTETTFGPSNPMTREMFRIVLGRMGADVNELMDNNRLKENITREQLATLLYRMAQKKGLVKTGGQDTQNIAAFADGTQISSWAKEAMAWANAQGILKGNDQNMLNPKAGVTRAEVAVMLMRFDTMIRNYQ